MIGSQYTVQRDEISVKSVLASGSSNTPIPDSSIEADDVDEAYERVVSAGYKAEYGPVEQPWGVTRFYGGGNHTENG